MTESVQSSAGEIVSLKRMVVGSVIHEAIERWITDRENAGRTIDLYDHEAVKELARFVRDKLLSDGPEIQEPQG
ncbi:hypothetical protein FOS14_00730 [Skermania sp. ID1734]|uniref:hypothetical protein n=1 Tax=Skermania sp. ID1734 TaxID=2597516 RepID=UPI00117EB9D9|nr:hypothetical protein [Skermania sp. ID1734]TSE01952.1 hypothetical protein FOS14_00730 [Skermania sp. ID1734]